MAGSDGFQLAVGHSGNPQTVGYLNESAALAPS